MKPTRTIRQRYDVQEESRTRTYGQEKSPRDRGGTGNVFLVGPRGSGKTTLGRMLAERLGIGFVDTDELVVARGGQAIDEIVRGGGWDRFRELERDALAAVCREQGQVVATGGGIVLSAENRSLMRSCGKTFYLMAEPGLLVERLGSDPLLGQRPPLTGLPLREEIAAILNERAPLYMECADFILRAEAPLEELVDEAQTLLAI